jgi:hypothetical protein
MPQSVQVPPPDPSILERNLRALASTSIPAVRAIMDATPADHIDFVSCDDGSISATIREPFARPRQLASLRRPLEEASRWAQSIDISQQPGVVVCGFGLGHHLAALGQRLKRTGVIFCFEPDLSLLRAVLERIDHSQWIVQTNLTLLTDADDQSVIAAGVQGVEGLLAAGVNIASHASSLQRLGPQAERFHAAFANIMTAVRTTVVTTLVQVETSLRNAMLNLRHYALGPGVADLAQVAAGFPAVVVSAGPSLERNVELLSRPGVRDRVVIIATQTVLKPLLARGIKPHFVTALDYHEISRRFYEGLTAADVEGITLVVEPQANPAILDAFPGVIRCAAEESIDNLLGEDLARHMGSLTPGATVAHLAYYLARHLGCEPVILIGQDLGFTDGQYYAAGASIHRVWSPELSEFHTIEMLEWQRIVRARNMLRKVQDTLGREMYTDEQMHTYLVQFERDFFADTQRGLSIIDATEGGVAKRHTTTMTLEEALTQTDRGPLPAGIFDPTGYALSASQRDDRAHRIKARVAQVRADVGRLHTRIDDGLTLVRQMITRHDDQTFVNRSIARLERITDEATKLETAYWLVQFLNQTGTFNRFKADRAIEMEGLDPLERQKRQLERDAKNLEWLAAAAEQMGSMLDGCVASLRDQTTSTPRPQTTTPQRTTSTVRRTHAVILADPETGGLGTPRDLSTPVAGHSPLHWTLRALSRCTELDGIIVVGPNPELLRSLAGDQPKGHTIRFEHHDLESHHASAAFRRASRLWTRRCWRGGLGGTSIFDEIADPAALTDLMSRLDIDAALLVGPDWCLVDPELCDQLVARFREDPENRRMTFSQAPPGIGPCVLDRRLIEDLAKARPQSGTLSTLGSLLSYIPIAPQADPIAKPNCVIVPPEVRDAGLRAIADDPRSLRAISAVLEKLGPGAPANQTLAALTEALEPIDQTEIVHIDASPEGLLPQGPALEWALDRVRSLTPQTSIAVTINAPATPQLRGLVARLREVGAAAVHVRTSAGTADSDSILLDLHADVISVDFRDASDSAAADLVERLLTTRRYASGLPDRWIVPRLTRRDEVYEQIEGFVDRAIMLTGAAVLDPLPAPIPGERIAPFPVPSSALDRWSRTILNIDVSGSLSRGPRRIATTAEAAS